VSIGVAHVGIGIQASERRRADHHLPSNSRLGVQSTRGSFRAHGGRKHDEADG
jgi:hypothetical protein